MITKPEPRGNGAVVKPRSQKRNHRLNGISQNLEQATLTWRRFLPSRKALPRPPIGPAHPDQDQPPPKGGARQAVKLHLRHFWARCKIAAVFTAAISSFGGTMAGKTLLSKAYTHTRMCHRKQRDLVCPPPVSHFEGSKEVFYFLSVGFGGHTSGFVLSIYLSASINYLPLHIQRRDWDFN